MKPTLDTVAGLYAAACAITDPILSARAIERVELAAHRHGHTLDAILRRLSERSDMVATG